MTERVRGAAADDGRAPSSPAYGPWGTDQVGLTCLLTIEKRPRGVG